MPAAAIERAEKIAFEKEMQRRQMEEAKMELLTYNQASANKIRTKRGKAKTARAVSPSKVKGLSHLASGQKPPVWSVIE